MDITEILDQVKSPFTDEGIERLIETYIQCNCDINEFYKRINLSVEEQENPHLSDLYRRLFSEDNRGNRFVGGNILDTWIQIASSNDTLSVPNKQEDRVPIYRIYINAKGQDKAKIIEDYIRSCEDKEQSYKLKYSTLDGRQDEIVILSYGEDLARNIELAERITEGMSLGEPAQLLGRYKDKIGIGEEYIQAPIHSYTKTRLGIMPIVMQKYFLDHKPQFEQYLDEKNKGTGEFLLKHFRKKSQNLSDEIEELLDESEDLSEDDKKEIEFLRKQQVSYQNNIDFNIGNMSWSVCKDIPEVMKSYMAEHSEIAIPEIVESYRMACEIFGISRDGVFSKVTEGMIEQQKQTPLRQREAELSALEAEDREYDEAEEIKAKLEQRQGQNRGE